MIVTDKELNPLDDGVEYIIKTDQGVLDKMNAWLAPPRRLGAAAARRCHRFRTMR